MSKFFNALAVAVLGMALLMGAASALDSNEVAVAGTVAAASFTITDQPDGDTLTLTRGATATGTDSISVTANADWKVDVADTTADATPGYMSRTGGSLESPFEVGPTGFPVTGLATSSVNVYNTGLAGDTNVAVGIDYAQPVSGDEVAGDYSIELTYTVAVRTTG